MGMSHGYGAPADRREMTRLLAEALLPYRNRVAQIDRALDAMPMSEVWLQNRKTKLIIHWSKAL